MKISICHSWNVCIMTFSSFCHGYASTASSFLRVDTLKFCMHWLAKDTECVKEALYVFQKCTGVCEQDKIEICIFSRERSNLSSHSFGSRDGSHSVFEKEILKICLLLA